MQITNDLIELLSAKHNGKDADLVRRGLIYLRIQKREFSLLKIETLNQIE